MCVCVAGKGGGGVKLMVKSNTAEDKEKMPHKKAYLETKKNVKYVYEFQ